MDVNTKAAPPPKEENNGPPQDQGQQAPMQPMNPQVMMAQQAGMQGQPPMGPGMQQQGMGGPVDPMAMQAPQEPYGAQVLRRLHQDHMILMQEYDEMLSLLDHPEVKMHLVANLQNIELLLQETEGIFSEFYGHLGGMDGSAPMDTGMAPDDPAVEGYNDKGPEPTPEEAVEGMELDRPEDEEYVRKSLKKRVKSTTDLQQGQKIEYVIGDKKRPRYQGTGTVTRGGMYVGDDYIYQPEMRDDQGVTRRVHHGDPGHSVTLIGDSKDLIDDQEVPEEEYVEEDMVDGVCPDCGEIPCGCDYEDEGDYEDDWNKDGEYISDDHDEDLEDEGDLYEDEAEDVHAAIGFLQGLETADSLDEETKFHAFFHHKNLDVIGKAFDKTSADTALKIADAQEAAQEAAHNNGQELALNSRPLRVRGILTDLVSQSEMDREDVSGTANGIKVVDVGGPAEAAAKQRTHQQEGSYGDGKSFRVRKNISLASQFLKSLAYEKAFGELHRQEAKALVHLLFKELESGDVMNKEEGMDEEMETGTKAVDKTALDQIDYDLKDPEFQPDQDNDSWRRSSSLVYQNTQRPDEETRHSAKLGAGDMADTVRAHENLINDLPIKKPHRSVPNKSPKMGDEGKSFIQDLAKSLVDQQNQLKDLAKTLAVLTKTS